MPKVLGIGDSRARSRHCCQRRSRNRAGWNSRCLSSSRYWRWRSRCCSSVTNGSTRRWPHERRQLRTAVDNIPQGLVLYDASARIVVCNKPYIEMFGLSPDIAKQGCTMQRLIQHRKETGSFDGDVEAFCAAIIRQCQARQGDASADGSAGRPRDRDRQQAAEVGRLGRHHRGHHRAQTRRGKDRASCPL